MPNSFLYSFSLHFFNIIDALVGQIVILTEGKIQVYAWHIHIFSILLPVLGWFG